MEIDKFRDMFLAEAAEHLESMVDILMQLDLDPQDQDGIDALFREAHSIKGMAATMEHAETTKLSHHLENRLDICRKLGRISGVEIDWLLEATDLFKLLLDDIRNNHEERCVASFIATSPKETGTSTTLDSPQRKDPLSSEGEGLLVQLQLKATVAAPGPRFLVLLKTLSKFGTIIESTPSTDELLQGNVPDQLFVRLLSDTPQEQIKQQLLRYSELQEITFPGKINKPVKSLSKSPADKTVRISTELLDHFINLTGELITNRYQLQNALKEKNWQELDDGVGQLKRLVKNLHHQVLKVRMVSLEGLTGRLSRTVHDLSRSLAKEIQLKVEGAEIELDRAIVEELTDPLVHMVRNAVDHGIESRGTVSIKAWRERDQILIQVADDGRGIDPEKIRQKALDKGFLNPSQAQTIRDYDLFQLLCRPGFSTAQEVSQTSGRGVGMDVVKTAVEHIGGILLIDSAPGEGARITLKVPLSLAIIRVLIVECNGAKMAMPISRVIQTAEIAPEEVQSSGKQLMINYHDERLPLISLRKILKYSKNVALDPIPLVITEVLGRKIGLVVDQLVGQQEVYVQRLPAPFDQIRGCSGGTILGDGQIIFLLDLQSLFERRRG
ncbi:two-component system, chemotaxis family, sensor kinase CheA [Desulfuromusa kysingii]|uniref:Chemotaxis protein CheA n=1 Tax=Desulfuromusa kysingii TaxID=37625 RepID=A0A1H4AQT0_9BACT|nr:chemotaxis protein CheA [Desulfuromusa kysingii]SEA38138.1 two-component system, chemotaxis family, sensor kinase CheA [Desulfuromusa kysingii]